MNDAKAPRSGINPWWIVALLLGGGWLIYLALFFPLPSAERLPADFTWRFRDLDDQEISLGQFQGKPIFLNVWATWCPPCVGEMPSIAKLAGRAEVDGVVFLCVSVDDSNDKVKRFLADKGWPMKFVRADNVPRPFASNGIPATFIIAPNGSIAFSDVGARNWDDPETVRLLKQLRNEATSKR